VLEIANTFFETISRWKLILLCLLLVGIIGLADHAMGYEVSFSVFYLIPICLASWYTGKFIGFLFCVISTFAWLYADFTSGYSYNSAWIHFWNAVVRLTFFCVTAYILVKLKMHIGREAKHARIDALTKVMNSRAFKEEAHLLFKLCARQQHPIGLGYIDLDNFKTINDRLGHAEGDRVLQTVGSTLLSSVRSTDIVGRLGGDEFAIILPNTDLSGAKLLFKRLRGRLLHEMMDKGWPIGFSIGVAVFLGPQDENNALHYADALMYKVKKGRKNSMLCEVITGTEKNTQQVDPADGKKARR
jgi:diguanylate cyclase (GGDEF)-like protein